jgi:NADH-quinone oxidoreductase subunit J
MNLTFHIAAAVAVFATIRAISHANAVYTLLYFIVSLLAVALIFYLVGAPFIAALEVIVYAGAIIVLFLFVIMLLAPGTGAADPGGDWLRPRHWIGPGLLCAVLLGVTISVIVQEPGHAGPAAASVVEPRAIGMALFGPYLIAVQLAALLLLGGLAGASHLSRRPTAGRKGGAA